METDIDDRGCESSLQVKAGGEVFD